MSNYVILNRNNDFENTYELISSIFVQSGVKTITFVNLKTFKQADKQDLKYIFQDLSKKCEFEQNCLFVVIDSMKHLNLVQKSVDFSNNLIQYLQYDYQTRKDYGMSKEYMNVYKRNTSRIVALFSQDSLHDIMEFYGKKKFDIFDNRYNRSIHNSIFKIFEKFSDLIIFRDINDVVSKFELARVTLGSLPRLIQEEKFKDSLVEITDSLILENGQDRGYDDNVIYYNGSTKQKESKLFLMSDNKKFFYPLDELKNLINSIILSKVDKYNLILPLELRDFRYFKRNLNNIETDDKYDQEFSNIVESTIRAFHDGELYLIHKIFGSKLSKRLLSNKDFILNLFKTIDFERLSIVCGHRVEAKDIGNIEDVIKVYFKTVSSGYNVSNFNFGSDYKLKQKILFLNILAFYSIIMVKCDIFFEILRFVKEPFLCAYVAFKLISRMEMNLKDSAESENIINFRKTVEKFAKITLDLSRERDQSLTIGIITYFSEYFGTSVFSDAYISNNFSLMDHPLMKQVNAILWRGNIRQSIPSIIILLTIPMPFLIPFLLNNLDTEPLDNMKADTYKSTPAIVESLKNPINIFYKFYSTPIVKFFIFKISFLILFFIASMCNYNNYLARGICIWDLIVVVYSFSFFSSYLRRCLQVYQYNQLETSVLRYYRNFCIGIDFAYILCFLVSTVFRIFLWNQYILDPTINYPATSNYALMKLVHNIGLGIMSIKFVEVVASESESMMLFIVILVRLIKKTLPLVGVFVLIAFSYSLSTKREYAIDDKFKDIVLSFYNSFLRKMNIGFGDIEIFILDPKDSSQKIIEDLYDSILFIIYFLSCNIMFLNLMIAYYNAIYENIFGDMNFYMNWIKCDNYQCFRNASSLIYGLSFFSDMLELNNIKENRNKDGYLEDHEDISQTHEFGSFDKKKLSILYKYQKALTSKSLKDFTVSSQL